MNMTPATAPDLQIPDFELEVVAESRLEGLLALLESAQAEDREAHKRYEDLKDNIKVEVQALAPGRPRVIIKSRFLSQPWIMRNQASWRFDSKMLKAVDPRTWVQYATQTHAWYLEAVRKPRRNSTES